MNAPGPRALAGVAALTVVGLALFAFGCGDDESSSSSASGGGGEEGGLIAIITPPVENPFFKAEADAAKIKEEVKSPARFRPGMRLIREWNGKTHTVDVLDKGYAWNGKLYSSLSPIAREITGSRWSGPRFFSP